MFRPRTTLLLALLTLAPPALGAVYTPKLDTVVLERLTFRPQSDADRELSALRRQLAAQPNNAPLAAQVAQSLLERGRAEADPRYTGRAQAALQPWWTLEKLPTPIRVLRATIRQNLHLFPQAQKDLDAAVLEDPRNPQAWVTKATVLSVTGRLEEAKRSCLPLLSLSGDLVALSCLSGVSSRNGQALQSARALESVLKRESSAPAALRLWAWSTVAEAYERAGRPLEAEKAYLAGLQLDPTDAYLLAAYADFLLEQNRAQQVISRLEPLRRIDALLLRLALAEKVLGHPNLKRDLDELEARFDAARARGDTVHRREQALYTLKLLERPTDALQLAQQNFAVQKEPLDVSVLLESALAAGQPNAATEAVVLERVYEGSRRRKRSWMLARYTQDSVV